MIEISSKDTVFMYNTYHIAKAFFPEEEIKQRLDGGQEPLVKVCLGGGAIFCIEALEVGSILSKQEIKGYVTRCMYDELCKKTNRSLSWGILTGIRPTKLLMQGLEAGQSEAEFLEFFTNTYGVSPSKARLSWEIAVREKALLNKLDCEKGFSLYIGIPFCPSICSYCSFGSALLEKWVHKIDLYMDVLCKEITAIGRLVGNQKLNTIYVGGGTPTTLEPRQLERLLVLLLETFSFEHVLEFTVEAGRPDSISREKLEVLKKFPVTRISINPQTMQQKTLDIVGRSHTPKHVEDTFYVAREVGFDNINMDLIAGLPGENADLMRDSLRQIEKLMPDSMTVHALSVKRASKFGQEQRSMHLHGEILDMVEEGRRSAERMGLVPYYLYRQKNIAGNFENVGYAKVDKAGIYNILIMEEKQTILAAGAGASTKIILPQKVPMENGKESNVVRIENVKDVGEYMSRIDEMIERKGEWLCH